MPLRGDEVIVSLAKLDRVRAVDVAAGTMTAEAGVILENAHKAAEAEGTIFPLWLGSQGSARIGGLLSSNAGGVNVLAFGNARELTMGVEAVMADGRLYRGLNSLKKDNTGYDLKDLLVGAEGTLGIITAATLKIFPKPEDYETTIVNIAGPEAALTLFQLLRERTGSRLNAFEIIPHLGLDMQLRHGMLDRDPTAGPSPWYALIEVSRMKGGVPGALQAAIEAAFADGLDRQCRLRRIARRPHPHVGVPRADERSAVARKAPRSSMTSRCRSPPCPQLIAEGIAAAERLLPGIRAVPFGHMGDGNIHFNFSQPVGADAKAFMAADDEPMHEAIYEIVLQPGRFGFGRAWHRAAQGRAAEAGQGPGGARHDAGDQGGARSQGHSQSGQDAGLVIARCLDHLLVPSCAWPHGCAIYARMLLNIAFLDDATRPPLQKLEGLTDAQREPGQHLRMVHDHLRDNMVTLGKLIERANAGAVTPGRDRGRNRRSGHGRQLSPLRQSVRAALPDRQHASFHRGLRHLSRRWRSKAPASRPLPIGCGPSMSWCTNCSSGWSMRSMRWRPSPTPSTVRGYQDGLSCAGARAALAPRLGRRGHGRCAGLFRARSG